MAYKKLFLLSILSLVVGCAGNPVPVELPKYHPADPDAVDSRFNLPPDPFGNEVTAASPSSQNRLEKADAPHKKRGDLFESPSSPSATPEQEGKDAVPPFSEMPHHHNMEKGQ